MSNIATKLTYLNETKSKIKDSINLTGANITNEDTFRSYSEKLKQGLLDVLNNGNDYLYNNFPQLNDEGQNMSLTPTLEAPIKSELLGNTSQKTTTGKNVLPNDITSQSINGLNINVSDDGIITINGTANALTYLDLTTNFNSSTYAGYKFYGFPTNSQSIGMRVSKSNRASLQDVTTDGITLNDNGEVYIAVRIENGRTLNNYMLKPMLTNTEPTTYEPYTNGASPNPDYPQEVINATGRQEVKVVGKNLFNYDNSSITKYYGKSTPTKTENGILGGWGYHIMLPTPLPAGSYTISFKVKDADNSIGANLRLYDNNNQDIQNSIMNIHANNSKTINVSTNISIIRVDNGKDAVTTLIYDIQIEQNNQVTEYEDYKEQSYEINLGKNLFDKDNANVLNAYFNAGGNNVITSADQPRTIYIQCKPNTTYTINKITTSRFFVGYTNTLPEINVEVFGRMGANNLSTPLTITTGNDAKYLVAFIYHTSNDTTITLQQVLDSIQIEQGTQTTSYAPYFTPIELCKIGDYQDFIKKGTGNNLFDNSVERKSAFTIGNVGQQVGYGNSSVTYSYVNCSYLQANTTYTISWNKNAPANTSARDSVIVDENNIIVEKPQIWTNNRETYTFTPTHNGYLIFACDINTTNIMINEGTTATDYEPYGSKDKWLLTKKIGKVVLDGSESWTYYSVAQGSLFRSNNVILDEIKNNTYVPYSKYYQGISYNNYQNRQNNQFYINSDNNFLDFIDNRYTNANDLKTWLSTHNTIVYYILATPTTTEITEQNYPTLYSELNSLLNAKSYNGTTNIIITGETPADLKITVLKNE